MNDQLVSDAATYTTHNKQKKSSIPSAEFETMTPAIKRLQNYALYYTDTKRGQKC
jgi:hypothetical protein